MRRLTVRKALLLISIVLSTILFARPFPVSNKMGSLSCGNAAQALIGSVDQTSGYDLSVYCQRRAFGRLLPYIGFELTAGIVLAATTIPGRRRRREGSLYRFG